VSKRFGTPAEVPAWVGYVLLPALNLAAALVVAGLVVLAIGEPPLKALRILVLGSLGYADAIGYTLYYATGFVCTGLAVAIAFHGGLFNIGAEGQAYIGGLGVTLVCLWLDWLPFPLLLPLAIAAALLFGAAWAAIPAVLQAYRGSHIVVTTIMFNYIAAALMTWLLVEVLIKPGQQAPETREFLPATWLPFAHEALAALGIRIPQSPLNLSFLVALLFAGLVWAFLWRTRWGYEIRVVGHNPTAAIYGGVSPERTTVFALLISGALAGLFALNEVMGVHHRLLMNFTGGAGFVGIAVALMGRNHPFGICVAALLFGALYQGSSELSFEMPAINREMVVVIQGLVILFCGALENLFRDPIEAIFRRRSLAAAAG
jgi:general nucleoside transport system permease protein